MEISIPESEKRKDGSEFLVFKVCTKAAAGAPVPEGSYSVWRRFSDFETLHNYLADICRWAVLPPLPEKKINFKLTKMSVDKFDPEFVSKRTAALLSFMHRLAQHPGLSAQPIFASFLTKMDAEWREDLKIEEGGNSVYWNPSVMEEKMKQLSTAWKLKMPDRRFVDIRNYADALQENLTNILATHAKIASRVHALHQTYNDHGSSLNEWATREPAMFGSVLHHIGQHFDDLVELATEVLQKEEMDIAAPLQEYVFHAMEVRELVQRQEIVLYEAERSAAAVEAKQREIETTEKPEGLRGFFSNIVASSEEEKRAKIALLKDQLEELRQAAAAADAASRSMNERALEEVARFHEVKVRDIKEIFLTYARLQRDYAEQNLAHWQEIRKIAAAQ